MAKTRKGAKLARDCNVVCSIPEISMIFPPHLTNGHKADLGPPLWAAARSGEEAGGCEDAPMIPMVHRVHPGVPGPCGWAPGCQSGIPAMAQRTSAERFRHHKRSSVVQLVMMRLSHPLTIHSGHGVCGVLIKEHFFLDLSSLICRRRGHLYRTQRGEGYTTDWRGLQDGIGGEW